MVVLWRAVPWLCCGGQCHGCVVQGSADNFLKPGQAECQLKPEKFQEAVDAAKPPVTLELRMQVNAQAFRCMCWIDASRCCVASMHLGASPRPPSCLGTISTALAPSTLPGTIDTLPSHPQVDLQRCSQDGYDHSYYFISSFIKEHIAFHAKALKA